MRKTIRKFARASICAVCIGLTAIASLAVAAAADENELESQTEPKTVTQTETQTEAQTEIQTEALTEAQTETQAEAQTETQTEAQTEAQSETQTEAQLMVKPPSDPEYILGDVTLDKNVNLLDSIAIQKHSLSLQDFTDIQKLCGDADKNGELNLADSIMVQKYSLNMLDGDSEIGKPFVPEQSNKPAEPDTVELNKNSITLGVGESYTLTKSSPTGSDLSAAVFTSSNPSVVKVDPKTGKITALKIGSATVTVTTAGGASASCTITIKRAPTTMSLNKTKITLGVGEVYDLNSSLGTGEGAYSIVYSSGNTAVASVKASGGIVTAKSVGTAVVTAKAYNGVKTSCTVTVKSAPTSITLNQTSLTLGVGDSFDLNSSLPSGQASYSIVYSSSNASVAAVKASGGLVTAVNPGKATITAKTYNNITVVCTVTVVKTLSKQQRLVNKALSYEGQKYNHFIEAMAPYGAVPGDAWCAWFVSTVSKECGLTGIIPISGGAGSIPRAGVARGAGKWCEGHNSVPKVGDIVVFAWNGLGYYPGQDQYFSDHVGIVYKVDDKYVYTVEGNTVVPSPDEAKPTDEKKDVSNYDSTVCCRRFNMYSKWINGYYRPNY